MGAKLQIKPQRLWVIRHAESEANVDPIVHKSIPDHLIPLTRKGWFDQALPCGQFMKTMIEQGGELETRKFAIWHSSFLRACQTAKGIHLAIEPFSPHVWVRDQLGEISFGYGDGLSDEETAARHPDYADHQRRDMAHQTKHFTRSPNGESRADVGNRVRLVIDAIHRKTAEYDVTDHIIVTHGATGRVFAKEWLNLPYDATDREKNPNNCDVRLISRSPDDTHYIDYGYVYVKGKPYSPQAMEYPSALQRMRSDRYVPVFVRT